MATVFLVLGLLILVPLALVLAMSWIVRGWRALRALASRD